MLVTYIHGNPLIAEPVIERELNEIMEFDHAIRVDEFGAVTNASTDVQYLTPTLHEGELDTDTWELITHGFSGQDRYPGPIMHNSEFIGGGLARKIIETPGVYVALYCTWEPVDEVWIVQRDGGGAMHGPFVTPDDARAEIAANDALSFTTHHHEWRESDDNIEGWAVARWTGRISRYEAP